MKKFLILHYGFVPPTPGQMEEWNAWFESISDREVGKGHLPGGREISNRGVRELPFGRDSVTGFTTIEAADLDEATTVAAACPVVDATRVYEIGG